MLRGLLPMVLALGCATGGHPTKAPEFALPRQQAATAGQPTSAAAVDAGVEARGQLGPSRSAQPDVKRLPPKQSELGVLERRGLVVIIDAGLGRLFQRLKVAPAMSQGKFVGFQITEIDSEWALSSLRPGDVIRRLNGQPIERPEQALAAFERLRQADELVVEVVREGVPATLRYRIE